MWRALALACGLLLALPAGAQESAQEGAQETPGEQPATPGEAAPPEAGKASAPSDAQKSICLLLCGIDVLVIDDLQFLQGKSTQAEFCHTFTR
jgi:hypothetical protein